MSDAKKYSVVGLVLSGVLGFLLGVLALFAFYQFAVVPKVVQASFNVDAAIAQRDVEIQRLSAALQEAQKPEIPVSLTFRKAVLGPGSVLTVTNKGTAALQIRAAFTNDFRKETKTFALVIDPQRATEVGYSEGWSWVSGDTLKLEAPGYKVLEARMQ